VRGYLTERDSRIYEDNDVEVFIAGENAYYEFEINALNTIYEVFWIWKDALVPGSPYYGRPEFDPAAQRTMVLDGVGGHVHPRGERWGFSTGIFRGCGMRCMWSLRVGPLNWPCRGKDCAGWRMGARCRRAMGMCGGSTVRGSSSSTVRDASWSQRRLDLESARALRLAYSGDVYVRGVQRAGVTLRLSAPRGPVRVAYAVLLDAAAEFLASLTGLSGDCGSGANPRRGRRFRRAACRTGLLGVHRMTLTGLAVDLAEGPLARAGLTPAGGLSAEAMVARDLIHKLKAESIPYFQPVADTPGLARAVAATIAELRLEGVRPEQVAATGCRAAIWRAWRRSSKRNWRTGPRPTSRCCCGMRSRRRREGKHRLLGLPVVLLDVDLEIGAAPGTCGSGPGAPAPMVEGRPPRRVLLAQQ
jgi:hypothetical protein